MSKSVPKRLTGVYGKMIGRKKNNKKNKWGTCVTQCMD